MTILRIYSTKGWAYHESTMFNCTPTQSRHKSNSCDKGARRAAVNFLTSNSSAFLHVLAVLIAMHCNILVCFWWPWHYTTITRVSGQRCLLRPFVRFLASTSTSSCATDWRWTVNCPSGEMGLLYTMLSGEMVLVYTMLSGEIVLLYTIVSGEMEHLLTAIVLVNRLSWD